LDEHIGTHLRGEHADGLIVPRHELRLRRVPEGEAEVADVDDLLDLEAVEAEVVPPPEVLAPRGELAGAPIATVPVPDVEQQQGKACRRHVQR